MGICGHPKVQEKVYFITVMELDTIGVFVLERKLQLELQPIGVVLLICAVFLICLTENIECKGDETWKETPAGQYAYIPCPGSYKGYIGRFCTDTGEWGHTKDFCYLPDGQKDDEFEVEL